MKACADGRGAALILAVVALSAASELAGAGGFEGQGVSSDSAGVVQSLVENLLPATGENAIVLATVTGIELSQYEDRPGHMEPYTKVTVEVDVALTDSLSGTLELVQFNTVFKRPDGQWLFKTSGIDLWCMPGDSVVLVVALSTKHEIAADYPHRVIRWGRLVTPRGGDGRLRQMDGFPRPGTTISTGALEYSDRVGRFIYRPLKEDVVTLSALRQAIRERLRDL